MTTRSESSGLTGLLLLGVVGLFLAACHSPIYPTTTGSHAPTDPLMIGGPRQTYVLWQQSLGPDDPGMLAYLTIWLLASHERVVERAQVQRLFAEQRFQLQHSSDQEADLLRVGHMAGATQIIFIQISTEPSYSDAPQSMTVSLRSVAVESGEVQWTGSASASAERPFYTLGPRQDAARRLAGLALRRASCLTERGKRWVEPGPKAPMGACQ